MSELWWLPGLLWVDGAQIESETLIMSCCEIYLLIIELVLMGGANVVMEVLGKTVGWWR